MSVEQGFSGMVDHFGLASADLKLQSSTYVDRGRAVEYGEDRLGNNVVMGNYVEDAGTAVECVYHLHNGVLDLSDLKLGPHNDTDIIESISVETSNSDWPVITVTGYVDAVGTPGGNPQGKNFTLPEIDVEAKRCAQEIGFTVSGDIDLQSTSFEVSGETHYDLANVDTVGVVAFTGSELTVGGEVLVKDGELTVTYTAPNVVATTPPDLSAEMTGWTTASFEGTGFIEADEEPPEE